MEQKDKRIYYQMGEVAEMLDVNTSLLRFWEKKFDILKPHKNKKGNRMFTPQDVENLKLIYHLVKEKGMTLDGAAKVLKKGREGATRDTELMTRLLTVRSLLEEIREELRDGNPDETTIMVGTPEEVPGTGPTPGLAGEPEAIPEPQPETAAGPAPAAIVPPQETIVPPEITSAPEAASGPEPVPAFAPEPEPIPGLPSEPEPGPAPRRRIVEQTLF